MSHNPYECRYNFDLKPLIEPIYEVFSDGTKIAVNSNPIENLTDKEFAELIYSSSNQTD